MIIGNGDIASAIIDNDRFVYFCSGVSNSKCEDENEYEREKTYMKNISDSSHLIYFSTVSILYADTRYTKHKRQMEAIIKSRFYRYSIIRLGNIMWGSNPNVLYNYIKNHDDIEIQDVYRHMVSLEEFQYWMKLHSEKPVSEFSITGQMMKVQTLVERIKDGTL